MKVISIPADATDVTVFFEQARDEDILVRSPDGAEYVVSAVDDFDHEIARTRQNAKLMELLDARRKQNETVSLDEVERQLGLNN